MCVLMCVHVCVLIFVLRYQSDASAAREQREPLYVLYVSLSVRSQVPTA